MGKEFSSDTMGDGPDSQGDSADGDADGDDVDDPDGRSSASASPPGPMGPRRQRRCQRAHKKPERKVVPVDGVVSSRLGRGLHGESALNPVPASLLSRSQGGNKFGIQ